MKSFLKYLLATIAGIFISSLMLFFLLIIIISASAKEKPADVKANSILFLRLNEQIVERAADNPMDYLPGNFAAARQIGLNEILENIRKAKNDDNISGIYMEPMAIQAGMSSVKEIRDAIIDFKESGKFVVSYSELYTQKAYYLASVSDKVYLNPAGDLLLTGLASNRLFYKGTMEKLGVDVQIIRHGSYKSAVEPFMNEKMSEQSRAQTEIWMGTIWKQMLEEISEIRSIPVTELNGIAENLKIKTAAHSVDLRLVDDLKYKDEVINELKERTGTKEKDDLAAVTIRKYRKVPDKNRTGFSRQKVAVIYAHGTVQLGNSGEGTISSERISKAIRKARRDSSIKAIVLRINSGGGSALASDVIWREVSLASQTKPVVASFSDVAASGGYYIAAPADTIMAQPTTITGSIGVFALIPNMEQFFDKKLGITSDAVRTNKSADFGNLLRPLTADEKQLLQFSVEKIYEDFVHRVAKGRNMGLEEVDAIGEGRVWSGTNAKDNGLIDVYGGLHDAIEMAAAMAGIEKYRVRSMPRLEDPLEEFLRMLTENARLSLVKHQLGEEYRYLEQLHKLREYSGIQARLPYDIEIN